MTVSELITKLQAMDPGAIVLVDSIEGPTPNVIVTQETLCQYDDDMPYYWEPGGKGAGPETVCVTFEEQ